jgi:hypothetical protein
MSSSPFSSYDPLNNRVDFKLHGARTHLLNLKRLESIDGTLDSSSIRLQAEMEIDEILYYLVGVKDALLQEINSELNLGLTLEDVKEETINKEVEKKKGVTAKEDLMMSINKMQTNKEHPLGRINELHNHSKHRRMIGFDIAVVAESNEIIKPSLIIPVTSKGNQNGKGMRNGKGTRIPAIDYLEDSYKKIEKLKEIVRKGIIKYRSP